jgi:hypothetical protein
VVKSLRAIPTTLVIALAISAGLRAATADTFAKSGPAVSDSQQFNATQTSTAENSVATAGAFAAAPDCDKDGWDVVVESLFLWRNNHTPSWVAGDFDVGVGPHIIATRKDEDESAWEAEYFGVFGMDAHADQSNASSAGGIPNSATFSSQVHAHYRYESSLANLEFNVVRKRESLYLLAGFRYLLLDEEYRTHGDISSGLDPIPSNPSSGQLNPINVPFEMVRTTFTSIDPAINNLIGGQVGLRWRRDNDLWFYEATGKAGVFGNVYRIGRDITKGQVAFVSDLNFSAGLHLTDVWSVRAGYNLLWIDGVALAPHQGFGFPFVRSINPDNSIFLQGANIGLEAAW